MFDSGSGKGKGNSELSRRRFLSGVLKTACGVGLMGVGIGLYSEQASSLPALAIRPPGALPEDEFLNACIRCGLCVKDCPFDMLLLGQMGNGVAAGTPFFTARDAPCEMCEDIPCIKACPTNALDHGLTNIEDARMGLAVLVDQKTCIAFLGLRCEVCYNACPVIGKALTLDYEHNVRSGKHARFLPVVHEEYCTGCGICEKVCILEEAAIRVLPNHLAKGKLGDHYRTGWTEKEKAGKSLVTPDLEHKYNLPEGVQYDLQGKGLIIESEGIGVDRPSDKIKAFGRDLEKK